MKWSPFFFLGRGATLFPPLLFSGHRFKREIRSGRSALIDKITALYASSHAAWTRRFTAFLFFPNHLSPFSGGGLQLFRPMQLEVLSLHSSLRAVRLDHLSPKVATLLLFVLPFLSHTLTTGPQRITDDVSEVDSSFQVSPGPSSVGQRMNDLFFFSHLFFTSLPRPDLCPKMIQMGSRLPYGTAWTRDLFARAARRKKPVFMPLKWHSSFMG